MARRGRLGEWRTCFVCGNYGGVQMSVDVMVGKSRRVSGNDLIL